MLQLLFCKRCSDYGLETKFRLLSNQNTAKRNIDTCTGLFEQVVGRHDLKMSPALVFATLYIQIKLRLSML